MAVAVENALLVLDEIPKRDDEEEDEEGDEEDRRENTRGGVALDTDAAPDVPRRDPDVRVADTRQVEPMSLRRRTMKRNKRAKAKINQTLRYFIT